MENIVIKQHHLIVHYDGETEEFCFDNESDYADKVAEIMRTVALNGDHATLFAPNFDETDPAIEIHSLSIIS